MINAQTSLAFLVFKTATQFLIAKNAPMPVPIKPANPVIKVIMPFAVVIHSILESPLLYLKYYINYKYL
jgi:hypothetical protein